MKKKVIPLSETAERLSDLRREKKLTQEELAESLSESDSISVEQIKKIEQGKANLTPERLRQFSRFYGVDSDYILCLSDLRSKATTSAAETTGLSEDAVSFIAGLNPNNKKVLEKLLSQKETFTAVLDDLVPLLYAFKNIETYKSRISDLNKDINNAGKVNLMETRKTLEENKTVTAPYYAAQAFGEVVKNAF